MAKKYILKTYATEPKHFSIDYANELNAEQLAVVTQGSGSSLVLAGAGSGKTRTLVYRLAYLIEQGIKPERIMLVTFTNKASREMLNRIEILLKSKPKGLWGGTFHHIGNRMLRIYGKHIGINPDFVILDSADSKDLVKACLAQLNFRQEKYFPKAGVIHRIISLAANLGQSVDQIISERFSYIDEEAVGKIQQVNDLYQSKKLQANALDYDDLLTKWNDLLNNPEVKKRLANKFQHILVDEYQDTNVIQGEIIKNITGPTAQVLVVGDDSQSIYSFRGATVTNILDFPKLFPKAKTFKLETNYRSTPEILNLANSSIKHNKHQFKKTLRTTKASQDKPILVSAYDASQQANFICQRVLELQSQEGMSLNDIAVLFRAHFQSLELEIELTKRNIPYEMRGGVRFFEQAHIKDIIAFLKAFNNLHDELAWIRVLNLQSGIGDINAQKIWRAINSYESLDKALQADLSQSLAPKVYRGWQELGHVYQPMIKIDITDVAALIAHVLSSGYENYAKANFENAQDRIEDLQQLINYASNYDSLEKFLAEVALSEGFKGETITGYNEGPDETLTLSTVHQAKGLEWQAVFLMGLSDGLFPHAKVYEHPEELEEERRLFYVATTRAKDQLYLTFPTVTSRGDILSRPSQFLQELPEDVFEKWDIDEINEQESVIQLDSDGDEGILDFYLKKK